MTTMEVLEEDYLRVEKAIRFIETEALRQPSLAEIAASVGLSEFHFQRLFSRWVGISPKRFLQFLTKEYARKLLEESRDVLSVTYDAGLSSPGRLHELFVTCEAVTPCEVKTRGRGWQSSTASIRRPSAAACLPGRTGASAGSPSCRKRRRRPSS